MLARRKRKGGEIVMITRTGKDKLLTPCPKCGAEAVEDSQGYWKWMCDSFQNYVPGHVEPVFFDSWKCLMHQRDVLLSRIHELEQQQSGWPVPKFGPGQKVFTITFEHNRWRIESSVKVVYISYFRPHDDNGIISKTVIYEFSGFERAGRHESDIFTDANQAAAECDKRNKKMAQAACDARNGEGEG